jgi:ribosomal protein L11 methylase PrmA
VGTIAALQGGFDVVVANLIWEEAAPFLSSIASRLISGGTAVFSGILDIREQEARRGLGASGLNVVSVDCDGEWRTIVTGH